MLIIFYYYHFAEQSRSNLGLHVAELSWGILIQKVFLICFEVCSTLPFKCLRPKETIFVNNYDLSTMYFKLGRFLGPSENGRDRPDRID